MAYGVYIDEVLLPVAPPKLSMKINNQNKTINLINTGEVNILKLPGLTDVELDARLPNTVYPFAVYENGFQPAEYYLEHFEVLKVEKQVFQFIVFRQLPNGEVLFDTNLKVSLEDYTIKEDAGDGFDVIVSLKLKQYRSYGTKKVKVTQNKDTGKTKVEKKKSRPAKKVKAQIYTVKKGDCLWNIAKKFYGDGSKWKKIYDANKGNIKNPNLIYPGQKFKIPAK